MSFGFWNGKRVFVTGHTGFKGAWLCQVLSRAGADVVGYALPPPSGPNLFALCGTDKRVHSVLGDVRDNGALIDAFKRAAPEIVFHLAAQPLVLDSYARPAYTYETNVMGTVNILECVREYGTVRSFLNVTTDKVYKNNEWVWGYRETDRLDGFDPYSNSKSCSELVTASYKRSFFEESTCAISTARAGNVIGGGDFAENRIVPDCVRAAEKGAVIQVRNPYSTRPYQHVLEPLAAYMLIAEKQYEDAAFSGSYNVGPDENDCVTTGELVDLFCAAWGDGLSWETVAAQQKHEAAYLHLDCSKLKSVLGWQPRWRLDTAVGKTVEWARAYLEKRDVDKIVGEQIESFFAEE